MVMSWGRAGCGPSLLAATMPALRAPGETRSARSPAPPAGPRARPRMAAFQELDFLDFSDSYTEDERMVRDTVRGWVTERFLPLVMEHWEAGTFPTELTPELAELGVFGSNLPEKYGCAGLNNKAYGLICQELERGDSGLRSYV